MIPTTKTSNYPFIVQFNVNSIKERPNFVSWIQKEQPIVVALQETLVNDKKPNLFTWPTGYKVIRKPTYYNTNGRPIGGSALLIREENFIGEIDYSIRNNNGAYNITNNSDTTNSDTTSSSYDDDDYDNEEQHSNKFDTVIARVQIGKKKCTVCSLYWKQGKEHDATEEEIANFINALPQPFILMGDMNARSTLWGSNTTCPRGRALEGALTFLHSVILNDESPTRMSPQTGHTTCPDVTIISDTLALDLDWFVYDDNFGSDHFPIIMPLLGPTWLQSSNNTIYPTTAIHSEHEQLSSSYDWKNANWDTYKLHTANETALQQINNMTQMTKFIHDCTEKSVPFLRQRSSSSTTAQNQAATPWWTQELRILRNKTRSTARRFRRNKSERNGILYRETRATFRRAIRQSIDSYWKDIIENLSFRSDMSQTWHKIRVIRGQQYPNAGNNNKNAITLRNDITGELIREPQRIADIFAKTFTKISSSDNTTSSSSSSSSTNNNENSSIKLQQQITDDYGPHNDPFTIREFSHAMQHMNQNSAPGLLKLFSSFLFFPIFCFDSFIHSFMHD